MQKLLQNEAKQNVQGRRRWRAVGQQGQENGPQAGLGDRRASLGSYGDPPQSKRALTRSFHGDLTTWLPGSHFRPLVPSWWQREPSEDGASKSVRKGGTPVSHFPGCPEPAWKALLRWRSEPPLHLSGLTEGHCLASFHQFSAFPRWCSSLSNSERCPVCERLVFLPSLRLTPESGDRRLTE